MEILRETIFPGSIFFLTTSQHKGGSRRTDKQVLTLNQIWLKLGITAAHPSEIK